MQPTTRQSRNADVGFRGTNQRSHATRASSGMA